MPITTSAPPPPKSASRLIGGTGASTFGSDVPQHAGEREVVDVVADVVGERAVLAPAGHARVDEPVVAGAARVGTDTESLGDAGPEPFEQHVGLLAQAQHDLGARRDASGRCRRCAGRGRSPSTATRTRRRSNRVATSVARSRRSTSAPMSASSIPANCTGPMFGSSTTRTPASGPGTYSLQLQDALPRSRRGTSATRGRGTARSATRRRCGRARGPSGSSPRR